MHRTLSPIVAAIAALAACATAWAYEPQINYALQCMGCHTPDGAGVPDRVPSIRETLLPFAGMADGRRYLVQVPGSAQSTLSNAELAALLNWMIRNLSSERQPRSFAPFTEQEVTAYRTQTLVRVRATRERLLRASVGKQP
jgi:cytochrome c551/c552